MSEGDTYLCPNCGLVGYQRGDSVDGDLKECGNENCSVYLFWIDRNVDTGMEADRHA